MAELVEWTLGRPARLLFSLSVRISNTRSREIVLHRNNKVLLIKNHKGWDLPGGHIKQDENILSGLKREVFEETGLTLSTEDVYDVSMQHRNKKFFCGQFATDDIQLSDEHYEYGFYTLAEVLEMTDIVNVYKKVIKKCLDEDDEVDKKLKITITGHASAGLQPAGPR